MQYVLMERSMDPSRQDPIHVSSTEDQAYLARDLRCAQYAKRANAKRAQDFEKGYATSGCVQPREFFHKFTVIPVPRTLPDLP